MIVYRQHKAAVVIYVFISFLTCGCLQTARLDRTGASDIPAAPALEISSNQIDLGTIVPGRRAAKSITLQNIGGNPLQIRTLRTSDPAYLKVHLSEHTIPASGSVQLHIELASDTSFDGVYQQAVILYSDDPNNRVAKVKVTALFTPPVKWRPIFIDKVIPLDQTSELPEIVIVSQNKQPMGPLAIDSMVPFLKARSRAIDSNSHILTLELDPDAPLGLISGKIVVKTQHPEMPIISIPVKLYIIGDIVTEYGALEFGIVAQDAPVSAKIELKKWGDRRVEVLGVESHLPVETQLELEKTQTGSYQLTVSLTSTPPLQSLTGHLTIITDNPTQPRLEVPTEGWVAADDPFSIDGSEDTDEHIYQLLLYALYLEESFTPEDVIDLILGGHRDGRSVALLMRAFESENWHKRMRALQVLGQLGNQQPLEMIRQAVIEDPDEDVRGAAAAALVDIVGGNALPELELALQDNDELVRMNAAKLLGEISDPRAVPWLLRAKNDEEENVREEAERALKEINSNTK